MEKCDEGTNPSTGWQVFTSLLQDNDNRPDYTQERAEANEVARRPHAPQHRPGPPAFVMEQAARHGWAACSVLVLYFLMPLNPQHSDSASEEVGLFADRQECTSSADTRGSGGSSSPCCGSPRAAEANGKLLHALQQQQAEDFSTEAADKNEQLSPAQGPAEVLISRGHAAQYLRCSKNGRRSVNACMRRCCHSADQHHFTTEREHATSAHFGKWQKILWKKQPHPDCYVDETFLNTLMRNANLTRYMYSDLCKSTVVLTQHLSCILIFLLVYRMIVKRSLAASTLVIFDVVSLPLGYALRWSLRPAPRAARQVLQSAIIVFGVLRILAPVLQTLTQSFSDDTVISLTSICLLIHIPLNDYSYVYRNPETIDEPLGRLMSLNVALFANVLLASRLSTSTEVFAFLFFGIEVFALAPMARRYLLLWSSWACTYVVTPFLILLTSALVYLEGSGSNVLLYLLLMFFITFVGPYWLIRSQKYKNEISGPWDIPCVKNYT
ncbi:phosphatidylinositol N-acetylglucosaminyltransferase subunit, putative [Eimeria maxima]|uniref:Phosphatidylinositol N-acetylglucosaminyltransferase subunit, putative n=1 Tax=Eimeria maxima TaxID=5804 RepID=U6MGZ8_EIMMA|nr:phosphatidylinositol N-acetylglucosaminyltransferase subunit, putative [Eimeria maxima]CDJ60920.1 phosphatidylinositol N-acetylglucosaminyltransferase subunit, putative [Eimeria maxima]